MTADRSSRHAGLPTYRVAAPARGGTVEIWQPRLRTLPAARAHVEVRQDERPDALAHRTLGDAFAAWRLADANAAYDPRELDEAGRVVAVPPRTGSGGGSGDG